MKNEKKILCVCNSSAKENILKVIREMGYEDKVEVVATRVDVKNYKPSSDIPLREAIKKSIEEFEKYKVGVTDGNK